MTTADRPYSLLITDDDAAQRETLRDIFEPAGYRTFLADSGEQAIDIVRHETIHLALMDMHLPKLTGLETIQIVRQMRGGFPTILISAEQDDNLMRKALSAARLSASWPSRSAATPSSTSWRGRWRSSISRSSPTSPSPSLNGPRSPSSCSRARPLRHDIPNAQVDRSIQATLRPGRIEVEYEVSLAELTLTQELRELVGPLEGGDREAWLDLYGRETGPLNAKGFKLEVDGLPIDLAFRRFTLVLEGHPRYNFTLDGAIPPRGRLMLQDLNFTSGEGTCRLAIRGLGGVKVSGDGLPGEVSAIPIVPVWKLTDAEERRTKRVEVTYSDGGEAVATVATPAVARAIPPAQGLTALLDRASKLSTTWLALLAFSLGAAHAAQPGHGKTLVAASAIAGRGGTLCAAALALLITIVHVGSVLLVALGLWATRTARYAEIDRALARFAGFSIAAIGLWRVGRHLAGFGEHDGEDDPLRTDRSLLGLGMAGGLVPCWDAIVLIVLAEALGRLALGLSLLVAFSLGMATVLVGVGLLAGRLRSWLARDDGPDWSRRLGLAGGGALAIVGLAMLVG